MHRSLLHGLLPLSAPRPAAGAVVRACPVIAAPAVTRTGHELIPEAGTGDGTGDGPEHLPDATQETRATVVLDRLPAKAKPGAKATIAARRLPSGGVVIRHTTLDRVREHTRHHGDEQEVPATATDQCHDFSLDIRRQGREGDSCSISERGAKCKGRRADVHSRSPSRRRGCSLTRSASPPRRNGAGTGKPARSYSRDYSSRLRSPSRSRFPQRRRKASNAGSTPPRKAHKRRRNASSPEASSSTPPKKKRGPRPKTNGEGQAPKAKEKGPKEDWSHLHPSRRGLMDGCSGGIMCVQLIVLTHQLDTSNIPSSYFCFNVRHLQRG